MWNCVEDRVSQGHFGRVIRKVIFQDVYADRTAVLSEKPIATNTLPFLKVRFYRRNFFRKDFLTEISLILNTFLDKTY